MKTYATTVWMTRKVFEQINGLLKIRSLEELTEEEKKLNPMQNDCIGVFFAEFEDGASMTFDVCSGEENYYDNCILFVDKDDKVGVPIDCIFELPKSICVDYGMTTYIVNIDIKEGIR